MCDALFIGADRELPLIEFKEGESFIHIMNISQEEQAVLSKIEKPFVYYLGAYEGCSCGFRYGVTEQEYGREFIEQDEETKGRRSVEALFAFLSRELRNGEEFILYNVWEGEFNKPIERESTVQIDGFSLPEHFEFSQNYRVRVVRGQFHEKPKEL